MSLKENEIFVEDFKDWWDNLPETIRLNLALDADYCRDVKSELGLDIRESFEDVHELNQSAFVNLDGLLAQLR